MTRPTLWTSTRTSGSVALGFARVAGADLDVRFISLRAGEHRTPDYLAINPKGQVPALQLADGATITEIPAIAAAIGDMAPESGLIPAAGTPRLKALEWLAWCHFTMAGTVFPSFAGARMAGGDEAAGAALRAAGPARILSALGIADRAIGSGTSLLGGEAVTAPDVFLSGLVGFCGFLKVDVSSLSGVLRLDAAVRAHPGMRRAAEEEAAEDARRAAAA